MENRIDLNDIETLEQIKLGGAITKDDLEEHFNTDLGEIMDSQFINDRFKIKIKCEKGEFEISSTEAHKRTYSSVDTSILAAVFNNIK